MLASSSLNYTTPTFIRRLNSAQNKKYRNMLAVTRVNSLKKMQLSYKTIHRQNAGKIRALCILSEMYNGMLPFQVLLNLSVTMTLRLLYFALQVSTVKFQNFRTPKIYLNIQTKRPNLRVFCQNDANGIANSEDPDQIAPLGAV